MSRVSPWSGTGAPFGDFYYEDDVKGVYYREAERLLPQLTGTNRVHIFDPHRAPPCARRRGSTRRPSIKSIAGSTYPK